MLVINWFMECVCLCGTVITFNIKPHTRTSHSWLKICPPWAWRSSSQYWNISWVWGFLWVRSVSSDLAESSIISTQANWLNRFFGAFVKMNFQDNLLLVILWLHRSVATFANILRNEGFTSRCCCYNCPCKRPNVLWLSHEIFTVVYFLLCNLESYSKSKRVSDYVNWILSMLVHLIYLFCDLLDHSHILFIT